MKNNSDSNLLEIYKCLNMRRLFKAQKSIVYDQLRFILQSLSIENYKANFIGFGSLLICLCLLSSCALFAPSTQRGGKNLDYHVPDYSPKVATISDPIKLQISAEKPRVEVAAYRSHSIIKTFEKGQILHQREELLDFLVQSYISDKKSLDGFKEYIELSMTTLTKNGPGNLHDFAFPEIGETINFKVSPNGKVLSAGAYPLKSIFYVPQIPLPSEEIKVGDTWENSYAWKSLNTNIEFDLNIVSIFKSAYLCGEPAVPCADIEVSGAVGVDPKMGIDLKGEFNGRLLIRIDTGTILWSGLQSQEIMRAGDSEVRVASCLDSLLKKPENFRWLWQHEVNCEADFEKSMVILPGLKVRPK